MAKIYNTYHTSEKVYPKHIEQMRKDPAYEGYLPLTPEEKREMNYNFSDKKFTYAPYTVTKNFVPKDDISKKIGSMNLEEQIQELKTFNPKQYV